MNRVFTRERTRRVTRRNRSKWPSESEAVRKLHAATSTTPVTLQANLSKGARNQRGHYQRRSLPFEVATTVESSDPLSESSRRERVDQPAVSNSQSTVSRVVSIARKKLREREKPVAWLRGPSMDKRIIESGSEAISDKAMNNSK